MELGVETERVTDGSFAASFGHFWVMLYITKIQEFTLNFCQPDSLPTGLRLGSTSQGSVVEGHGRWEEKPLSGSGNVFLAAMIVMAVWLHKLLGSPDAAHVLLWKLLSGNGPWASSNVFYSFASPARSYIQYLNLLLSVWNNLWWFLFPIWILR